MPSFDVGQGPLWIVTLGYLEADHILEQRQRLVKEGNLERSVSKRDACALQRLDPRQQLLLPGVVKPAGELSSCEQEVESRHQRRRRS